MRESHASNVWLMSRVSSFTGVHDTLPSARRYINKSDAQITIAARVWHVKEHKCNLGTIWVSDTVSQHQKGGLRVSKLTKRAITCTMKLNLKEIPLPLKNLQITADANSLPLERLAFKCFTYFSMNVRINKQHCRFYCQHKQIINNQSNLRINLGVNSYLQYPHPVSCVTPLYLRTPIMLNSNYCCKLIAIFGFYT